MKRFWISMAKLALGIPAYSLGLYLCMQANIGLAPWEAFAVGGSYFTGLSVGAISILSGVVILIAVFALKEKIGVGTILNTVFIGVFLDVYIDLGLIPARQNFFAGVALLLTGQVIICLATYFYIGAALGGGPRDSLMTALGKRMPKVPIGLIRGSMEAIVLLVGWLMGAKVGVGTVMAVFGIGFILQTTFRILKFDVKAVQHEGLLQTAGKLVEILRSPKGTEPELPAIESEPVGEPVVPVASTEL